MAATTDFTQFYSYAALDEWLDEQDDRDEVVSGWDDAPEGLKLWLWLAAIGDSSLFALSDEDLKKISASATGEGEERSPDVFTVVGVISSIFTEASGLGVEEENWDYGDLEFEGERLSGGCGSFYDERGSWWQFEVHGSGGEIQIEFEFGTEQDPPDQNEQQAQIGEVLADTAIEGKFEEFFRQLAKRLNAGEDFGEAWNEVLDGDKEIDDAVADWKENLYRRLDYVPDSDWLDDVLEEWALRDFSDDTETSQVADTPEPAVGGSELAKRMAAAYDRNKHRLR